MLVLLVILLISAMALFYFVVISPLRMESRMSQFSKRIVVDLNKCELYTTIFYEEKGKVDFFNPIGAMLDPNLYDNNKRDASKERVYVKYIENNIKYVSTPIDESQESIRLKFEKKKVTYIFIDGNNDRNYFFDLNFLTEK